MNEKSRRALHKHPEFRSLIRKHGLPEPRPAMSAFHSLTRAIMAQQISGAAATSILTRFKKLYRGKLPSPQQLARTPAEKLRAAGVSPQKAGYLHDLAAKFSDGTVRENELASLGNENIISALTQVKGVGVWTVQMYLLFTLRRPDILPTADLGIQKGFMVVYGLRTKPSAERMERLAAPWRKHASLASWYLWRAAEKTPLHRKNR